jgi:3-(3-hydroxy-phenyl)propionate hydroxylase
VAKGRDEQMLAARKAGVIPIPRPSPPPLARPCILGETPGAGDLFPQPVAFSDGSTLRLDDRLGGRAWLIGILGTLSPPADVRAVNQDDPEVAPFRGRLAAWLDGHSVEAVLNCDPGQLRAPRSTP